MAKSSSAQNRKSCIQNNESNSSDILYTLHVNLCTDFSVQLNHNMNENEVDAVKGSEMRLNSEKLPF